MKVVALVSGGKDSCYAMMKCIHYGHEIVALANLLPIEDSVDELDSYMYQTVGHQIIVNYSECMGLPLFRRRIQGSTSVKWRMRMLKEAQVLHIVYPDMFMRLTRINTGRKLLSRKNFYAGDEVEDMFLLLHEVKRQIPSITAVSSGAIGSDYQRLRVESVCSRLGLVSLAYLWKQDQLLLLQEMVNNGILAITVKVAAMGLDPAKHLGKEISALESYLHKLNELYGINVCGEGGEYETLTLDCPLFVNARIVLDEYKVVLHSSNSIAPVGVLHPVAFHLENKAGSSFAVGDSNHAIDNEKVNYLFEVNGDCQLGCEATSSSIAEEADTFDLLNVGKQRFKISKTKKGDMFSIGCWLIDSCNTSPDLRGDLGALLKNIESELLGHAFGWENVLYVHLYISDMTEFAAANELYVRFIKQERCPYGVPSRSTIELPLLEVSLGSAYIEILVAGDRTKRVLHVQSISSWAPSCIGPYSQATLHKEILHMAGQLGLDPPTMTLCNGGPTAELEQALENSEAVAKCFNCSISTSAILFSLYCSTDIPLSERRKVEDTLQATLEQMRNSHSEKGSKSKVIDPIVLYILAPCLPKRALVEVKPILFVPEDIEEVVETEQYLACNSTPTCWGFKEAPWHNSCMQKCVIRGKICALVLCITSNIAQKICSRSINADEITEEHLGMVSKFCIYLIDKNILENGFSWEDIMNLRIYFPTRLNVSLEALSLIFSRTFAELAEISQTFKVGKNPIFNLVPVLGSGQFANCMDDVVSCEIFVKKS